MEEVIKEIYEEVKRRCMLPSNAYGIGAWDHHIELVYNLALDTYQEYNADKSIVALAALLHDIASVTDKNYTENHHIIGADIAKQLLQQYNLSYSQIEQITNCILNHRGSVLKDKLSPEEICIADCDAMAHFYSVPSLLRMVYVEKELSIDEGAEFVYNKLERSYNKLSENGKKLVTPQREAAKLLLLTYTNKKID